MSISSTNRKAGPYSCNGATVAFPFAFKVFAAADVRVVLTDADGVEIDLVLGSGYTVTLNSDQDTSPGGTVTTVATYATGYLVTLTSQLQNLQPVVLTNAGGFYPRVINDALDRVTILVQQLAEAVARSLKTAISAPAGVSSQLPAPVPYALLGWNADGTGFQNADPSYANSLFNDLGSSATGKGSKLVAFTQRLTGAVAHTVEDKLAESASVFDFMTPAQIADVKAGTFLVDVTAAIQAALNVAYRVYCPAGGYLHTRLTLRTGNRLIGDGVDVTTFKLLAGANDYGLYLNGITDAGAVDMTIDGNSANNTAGGMGVRVEGASYDLLFNNVRATNWHYDGFAVTGSGSRVQFQNCQADENLRDGYSVTGATRVGISGSLGKGNTRFGIVFGAGANQCRADSNVCIDNGDMNIMATSCTDAVFDGNITSGSAAGHGLQFNTVTRGVMVGNSTYGNGISGLDVYASTYCAVTGNTVYNNTVRGIEVDSGSYYTAVTGNVVYRNGEVGVSVFRSPNTTVMGNHILENGTSSTPKYGLRLWDTAGTLPSANCRIIGNNITDDRGGSATQFYGISIENSATNVTLIGNKLDSNVSGPVNLSSGAIAYCEGNQGYSVAPIALALQNSWVSYDANWEVPQSYIDASGIVFVTGSMKNGTTTAGTVVATLPAGQRPAKVSGPFITYSNGTSAAFYVLTNGNIVAQNTLTAALTSLCGITFKAA